MPIVKFTGSMPDGPIVIKDIEFAENSVKLLMASTLALMAGEIIRTMQTYPPQAARTKYGRTRRLAASWQIGNRVNGPPKWSVEIVNYAQDPKTGEYYAGYVQDEQYQTRGARDAGWQTIQRVMNTFIQRADEMFGDVADELIKLILGGPSHLTGAGGERFSPAYESSPFLGLGGIADSSPIGTGGLNTPFGGNNSLNTPFGFGQSNVGTPFG